MNTKKALFGIVLILVILFLAINFLFSSDFDKATIELKSLEMRVNLDENILLPGTKTDLATYKSGLSALKRKWFGSSAFRDAVDLKLLMVETGEEIFFIGDEFGKINRINPNCLESGEINSLKKITESAKKGFNNALVKRNRFVQVYPNEAKKLPEVSNESFEQTINGSIIGVNKINEILGTYC